MFTPRQLTVLNTVLDAPDVWRLVISSFRDLGRSDFHPYDEATELQDSVLAALHAETASPEAPASDERAVAAGGYVKHEGRRYFAEALRNRVGQFVRVTEMAPGTVLVKTLQGSAICIASAASVASARVA